VSRPTPDSSGIIHPVADYGLFVICDACGRKSDIWAEQCVCGVELLPDDRKVKLAKSGGAPFARMTRRADRLDAAGTASAREQAVRDLAALRASAEGKNWDYTPRIVHDLIALGRLDEAAAEAESVLSRAGSGTPSAFAVEALAREFAARKDERTERWLRLALDRRGTSKEHLELQMSLIGLLSTTGREPEALEAFERAVAELDALRKKTSKSTVATLSGSSEAFTGAYWSQSSDALDNLRMPVVGASAAAALTDGQRALTEVHRLEAVAEVAAARDVANTAASRLAAAAKRLKPLGVGLPKAEGKATLDPLEDVVRSLQAEFKRLKKLAKRS